jgi:PAS domain S-box-containing protein
LRSLAALVPVGIVQTDLDGTCLFVNDTWTGMTGIPASEVVGRNWRATVHPSDVWRLDAIRDQSGVATELTADCRLRTASGGEHWVHVAVRRLTDSEGNLTGRVAALTDVNARKALEAAAERDRRRLADQNVELRDLDGARRRYLATVSHELRTPLTSIVSFTELIKADEDGPGRIAALWKQRLRWARGNLQVTRKFRGVWFRPHRARHAHRLGGISFGLFWFALLLQPAFMIAASAALATLYFIDQSLAWHAFHALWITNVLAYAFITSYALLIDPRTGRHVWREALLFPGVVSVIIMIAAVAPVPLRFVVYHVLGFLGASVARGYGTAVELFTYVWLAASMGVAYLAKLAEPRPGGRVIAPVLIYLAGYGSLLCAVMCAAYVKELAGADTSWDKTEKTGKVVAPA